MVYVITSDTVDSYWRAVVYMITCEVVVRYLAVVCMITCDTVSGCGVLITSDRPYVLRLYLVAELWCRTQQQIRGQHTKMHSDVNLRSIRQVMRMQYTRVYIYIY